MTRQNNAFLHRNRGLRDDGTDAEWWPKACNYGCCGFGTCVKACPFDAIHIVDGVAVVDQEACKACGKCIKACPKNLIELVPYEAKHLVRCSSREKGKDVMAVCSTGCIGCRMCQKVCPADAIVVENNLAWIDPEKCTNCERARKNVRKRSFFKESCAQGDSADPKRSASLPCVALAAVAVYLLFMRFVCGAGCPLVWLTGFPCPACGLTRAAKLVFCARFTDAYQMHPMIYPILLFLFLFFFTVILSGRSCHMRCGGQF